MRLQSKPQLVEAVMFFTDQNIFKQLLMPEFEAVLDGVVNMPECIDQQVRAAYVLINQRLLVRSLVFFYIDFDDKGAADPNWNIPLRHLAERAQWGPDLGAGPIRLASSSQCSEPAYQMHLWSPDLSSQNNHLFMIRDAVHANSLGLLFDEAHGALAAEQLSLAAEDTWNSTAQQDAEARAAEQEINQKQRQKAAHVIRQQRLRMSTMLAAHEEQLAQLRLQNQQGLAAQQHKQAQLQHKLQQQKEQNTQLKQQCSTQLKELTELTADVQSQMLIFEQVEHELHARIAAASDEHQEQMEALNLALAAKSTHIQQLQAEQEELKLLMQQHVEQAEQHVLEHLNHLGVVFVACHPGAGHFTIPLQDMALYQQDTMAYVARKCAVSEAQYSSWLAHYEHPVCSMSFAKEKQCGAPLTRESSPSRFIQGDTDRCAKHKKTS